MRLILILLLLVGFVISNIKPIWLDEISSLTQINVESPQKLIMNYYSGSDTNPPLYFLVLFGLEKIFGPNIYIFRLFSLLMVLIGIYFIQKNYLDLVQRMFVLLIVLTSPFIVFYLTSEIRPYSMQFMLAAIFFYLFIKNVNNLIKSNLFYLIYSIVTLCFLFVHYYSILYVIPAVILQLIQSIRSKYWKPLLSISLPILLLSFWSPALQNQTSIFHGIYWQIPATIKRVLSLPIYLFGYSIVILIPIILFQYFKSQSMKKTIFTKNRTEFMLAIIWIIIPIVIGVLSNFINELVYVERYFTVTTIAVIFLINEIYKVVKTKIMTRVFILIVLSNFGFYSFKNITENNKLNEINNSYLKILENQQIVLCESPHIFYQLDYYSKIRGIQPPILILDLEASMLKGNISNSLFDHYGNENILKYFPYLNIKYWDNFIKNNHEFIIINEYDRKIFEYRIINKSQYIMKEIIENVYSIKATTYER